ncbi:DUF7662 domain-containing protein [Enterovirga aerilata]|uniref:DUF7662 domain-containing protein n=1 Tax=Enterovirga aerilata TaxID=2730920 RepID=A0A849IAP9_9HYPH|nr:hypothetical protein [Enterovirga sp. DB1703]NNM74478.1 hypothetical protein [Enterovirga sp. DB1703]
MGKYTRLAEFLAAQHASEIVMSFADLERVIGEKLPVQASTERSWWRHGPSFNEIAQGWSAAGFTPDLVDIEERRLLFRRATEAETHAFPAGSPAEAAGAGRHPLFGCLEGVTHLVEGVDLTEPADPDWARIADRKTL